MKDYAKLKPVRVNEINGGPAVYFLSYKGYVCYVGMTMTYVCDRIKGSFGNAGHIDNKIFDEIRIMYLEGLSKNEVLTVESKYIKMFDPYYNVLGRFNIKVPPEYEEKTRKAKHELLEKDLQRKTSF